VTVLEEPLATAPLPHRFGCRRPFQVGLEEELLLVDPVDRLLRPVAEPVIAAARPACGRLSSEIFASELELVSPVCRTVGGLGSCLSELEGAVRAVGATVLGAGLHPMARFGDAHLINSPRYARVSDALRGLLRTPPAALHVHVGMPDPETAIRVCNGVRHHLPLLHSLAANSPFWYGQDSGLASARAAILRSYPRYGAPRWFRDWTDFSFVARELAEAADVADYTYFWWEVRPHPRLGTIEVRAPDAQACRDRTLALAALIHALAGREAEAPPPTYQSRDAVEEACYQATRYGLEARLPDRTGRLRPARELARDLVAELRPYARELGCEAELTGIERIVSEGNGADLQRAVHRERGMSGLLEWLVDQRRKDGEAQ
jgi:carboxylate-amine ligase